MLVRLSEFEGTCLTLLVRGLAPPPAAIGEAISRLPSERFGVTHVPPYNPSFGSVADPIMLSWAVRSAGGTAFISTLHTHPYRVRKNTSSSWIGYGLKKRCVSSVLGTRFCRPLRGRGDGV